MNHDQLLRPRLTAPFILGIGLLLAAGAQAQVYRSVGPDGRVSFSDSPPAAQNAPVAARSGAQTDLGNTAALPYTLRQTVQRYPVTLYTSPNCEPCTAGRKLLADRGIPFTEKTVVSNADIGALQQRTGSDSLPTLAIGQQQLKGFSTAEWTQYLNAAGYPAQSQLPARWKAAAATPLTTGTKTPVAAASASASAATQAAEPAVAPRTSPTNPAGIRF